MCIRDSSRHTQNVLLSHRMRRVALRSRIYGYSMRGAARHRSAMQRRRQHIRCEWTLTLLRPIYDAQQAGQDLTHLGPLCVCVYIWRGGVKVRTVDVRSPACLRNNLRPDVHTHTHTRTSVTKHYSVVPAVLYIPGKVCYRSHWACVTDLNVVWCIHYSTYELTASEGEMNFPFTFNMTLYLIFSYWWAPHVEACPKFYSIGSDSAEWWHIRPVKCLTVPHCTLCLKKRQWRSTL